MSAWSRRPQKFPSARTTSGSRGKVRRGGRGACRFTGLRLCEDTYSNVDKTRVVQIIMLQVCERGSGVYDKCDVMGGKGKKDTRTKKNKDKRGIKILAKDSGGGGDDSEKENMVLERREL